MNLVSTYCWCFDDFVIWDKKMGKASKYSLDIYIREIPMNTIMIESISQSLEDSQAPE